MAPGQTIRLLTRYHVGAHKDPRENRLTAALVALLTESNGLARRLAEAWLHDEVDGENQLEKYVKRMEKLNLGTSERLALLLAPAQRRPVFRRIPALSTRSGARSPGPFFVTWQDL